MEGEGNEDRDDEEVVRTVGKYFCKSNKDGKEEEQVEEKRRGEEKENRTEG